MLSKLDKIEHALDVGNHDAYRLAFNQLKAEIKNLKATQDKIHDMLLFEQDD